MTVTAKKKQTPGEVIVSAILTDIIGAFIAAWLLMLAVPYLYVVGATPAHPGYWPCFWFVWLGQGVVTYMTSKAGRPAK